ncbi:Calcineurin-like phosphoesterase superfamily domain-containing protein [Cladophialophora immunda]|nr:Calcineurin-like phosphoesterase superfamily domain-containing protein [Cladophialophora immunda]
MISTRILIISDTHAHLPLPAEGSTVPFHHPLPAADVLIHCGDLTMNGELSQHEAAVALLTSSSAALKIVIPGNHDLTLDRAYYHRFPGLHAAYGPYVDTTLDRIRALYTSPEARAAGIRYLEEGVARFTLRNGARLAVYASAYQPEFCNWAFGYARSVDRFNSPRHGELGGGGGPECPVPDHGEIDVMITHGPPKGILDKVWRGEGRDGENVGCGHLRTAVERCRPRIHCFGHIHEAWGAVMKRWDVERGGAPEGVYTAAEDGLPTFDDGNDGTGRGDRDGEQSGPVTMSIRGSSSSISHPSTVDPSQRQQTPEPETTLPKEPNPPYHPHDNPNSYYMYTDPRTDQHRRVQQDMPSQATVRAGETLLRPEAYEDQVRRRCASVDARGLEFGRETLFVNASIMNLRYRPLNAPWVVDVMLPEEPGRASAEE